MTGLLTFQKIKLSLTKNFLFQVEIENAYII